MRFQVGYMAEALSRSRAAGELRAVARQIVRRRRMSKSSKVPHILSQLSDQLFRGWSAFLVARHIDGVLERDAIADVRYLSVTVLVACVESTILALTKLTLPHKDSMHIGYLLNCCEQDPQTFPNVDRPEILTAVERHREQLEEVKPLIECARTWRNRAIAHLDKKHVNDPELMSSTPPIDMTRVEDTFRLLEGIINTYRGYLDFSEMRLSESEARIADEWERLVGLLQSDNKET